jgi:crossover junction endodeoxyribonuclease RuvC
MKPGAPMITVIGIDPGLAGTGIGLVSGRGMSVSRYSYGSIRTRSSVSQSQRLALIYDKISGVLKNQTPDLMVVEDVFSLDRYPKSGILLGKVSGIVLLAAAHHGIPAFEIPVRESKKILSGNGNAGKSQLEMSVRRYLNHEGAIRPYHSSDALALALIGLFRHS